MKYAQYAYTAARPMRANSVSIEYMYISKHARKRERNLMLGTEWSNSQQTFMFGVLFPIP